VIEKQDRRHVQAVETCDERYCQIRNIRGRRDRDEEHYAGYHNCVQGLARFVRRSGYQQMTHPKHDEPHPGKTQEQKWRVAFIY
jgi:hypothetical protein